MATMHPACKDEIELRALIPDADGGNWEREVYSALEQYTPATWHVWWNKHQEAGGFRHQYDFIVLVPGMGLVNLDAKGTGWTTDGQGQTICRLNGTVSIRKDIFNQAEKAQMTLQKVFDGKIGPNWGACSHLLVFRKTFSYPGKEDRYIDNLNESLRRDNLCLQHKIESVLEPFQRCFANFNQSVQDKVTKCLNAERELPPPIYNVDDFNAWDGDAEQYLSLQQRAVLSRLKTKNYIHVIGAAGTGKTVIAMQLFESYRRQGKSVLYICYNRALADELNYHHLGLLGDENGCIINYDAIPTSKNTAFTCTAQVARLFQIDGGNAGDATMWANRRKATANALENARSVFDILLVDEGQDLKDELIFSLFHLLKPNRKIVVFSDSRQNLFNNDGWELNKAMFVDEGLEEIHLNQNWRNTDEIHKRFKDLEDPVVESMIFENTRKVEIVDSCEQILSKILAENRRPCDIAVLYHADRQLAYIPRSLTDPNGHTIKFTDSIDTWRKGQRILKASVESFKGLESPIVVFFEKGLDELSELRYVGESRAKYELYIVDPANAQ